ncbi:hypothetical protein GY45DRAFT_1150348 [Cubamyces sp. BRFM 1775]|nr:hypothetical protein GY45DRAFT_1150348 [Cubamyces sp. BRFM 1775]
MVPQGSSVEHLILDAPEWRARYQEFNKSSADPPSHVDAKAIRAILDAVPNIQQLTVDGVLCSAGDGTDRLMPRCTVGRLEINGSITQNKFMDVLAVISTFEHIDVLGLSLPVYYSVSDQETDRLADFVENSFFPSIRSLALVVKARWPTSAIFRTIQRSFLHHPHTLERVVFWTEYCSDPWRYITEFCQFICSADVSAHMRELEIHLGQRGFPRTVPRVPGWNIMNHSRLRHLKHLILVIDFEYQYDMDDNELAQKINLYSVILQECLPPALRSLTLRLSNTDYADDRYLQFFLACIQHSSCQPAWAALDGVLQTLPSSPRVVFHCCGPWGDMVESGAIERCLREALPLTYAKGLVIR